jgi:hypothetical protein
MMKNEKTLFVVLDIETTEKKRLAFDVAWTITDKQGADYGSGSYLISEVLKIDQPFYKAKWSQYLLDLEAGKIAYATISEVIDTLNQQISELKAKGHRVILCAYNARFDMTWLPYTYLYITDDRNTDKFDQWTDLLDIWAFWGESVPLTYEAQKTASGKFLSTSAESAFRYEYQQPEFVEMHIGWHDVAIEKDILLKTLKRKKKMPVVQSKEQFAGNVWKKINERVDSATV